MNTIITLDDKRYSFAEFWTIATTPESRETWFELDNGRVIEKLPTRQLNAVVAAQTIAFLNHHVISNGLGIITPVSAGFRLSDQCFRQPDAAFIAKERIGNLQEKYFTTAPDLAVEVVSPDEDMLKKATEYIKAGTRLVWAIYVDEQVVHVFRPHAERTYIVQTYTMDETLDGEDVLPGFSLPVRDLFPA